MTDSASFNWTTVNPIRVTWEVKGTKVTGTYLSSMIVRFDDRDVERYTVQPLEADRQPQFFYGTAVLDPLMASVTPGEIIQITYDGIDSSGKREVKLFTLQRGMQI